MFSHRGRAEKECTLTGEVEAAIFAAGCSFYNWGKKERRGGCYWRVSKEEGSFMSAWPWDPNDLLTCLILLFFFFWILRVLASCLRLCAPAGDRD